MPNDNKEDIDAFILSFLKDFVYEMNVLSTIPRSALTLGKVAEKFNPLGDRARALLESLTDAHGNKKS